MQAAFVVGVHESHDKVVPKEILSWFNLSIYYKEITNWPPGITASLANAAGINWVQKSDSVVYGIEIDPHIHEDSPTKMVVVETVNNFIDFMYTYYKLEYEAPADKLCIKTQTDILHLYMKTGTVPEDIYNLEYNVTIIFSQETTDKIISDLKDSMSVEISKAKFKLNAASTLFDTIESNDSPTESPQTKAKVCFNITTCSDIKTWANAMKRKSKKKFHCIESFKFEELM